MNIEYVGRGFELSERVRDFTERKLDKLLKFVEEPIDVRVTLAVEPHHQRNVAELHLSHRLGKLDATDEKSEMFDAIHGAIDKLEKRARRARKKFIAKRRRADRDVTIDHHWPVDVLEAASVGDGSTPRIIESSHIHIKPMSIDEAALELSDGSNHFVVFRDSQTAQVSVLYRRQDDNFGLISPQA